MPLAGALKIRGQRAANAVMNQEAVTDMVLQEENENIQHRKR